MTISSARAQAIQIARDRIGLNPLYLDTETTGVGPDAELVEICIIGSASQVLFSSLIKPTRLIPSDATQIHGITNAMIRTAPTWLEIWPEVAAILDNQLVGVYNADFDLRLIKQTLSKYRLSWYSKPNVQFFCIMKLYAQFRGDWNPVYREYRWHSLEKAGQFSNITLPNSHRACDDTLLAREILHFIASQSFTSG